MARVKKEHFLSIHLYMANQFELLYCMMRIDRSFQANFRKYNICCNSCRNRERERKYHAPRYTWPCMYIEKSQNSVNPAKTNKPHAYFMRSHSRLKHRSITFFYSSLLRLFVWCKQKANNWMQYKKLFQRKKCFHQQKNKRDTLLFYILRIYYVTWKFKGSALYMYNFIFTSWKLWIFTSLQNTVEFSVLLFTHPFHIHRWK